jgi:hypothetical protein
MRGVVVLNTGKMIKEYCQEGNSKLDEQYNGTKKAIIITADEKVREFMLKGDVGLGEDERGLLAMLIAGAMMQSFSLGFGVGKAEGVTNKQIYL